MANNLTSYVSRMELNNLLHYKLSIRDIGIADFSDNNSWRARSNSRAGEGINIRGWTYWYYDYEYDKMRRLRDGLLQHCQRVDRTLQAMCGYITSTGESKMARRDINEAEFVSFSRDRQTVAELARSLFSLQWWRLPAPRPDTQADIDRHDQ